MISIVRMAKENNLWPNSLRQKRALPGFWLKAPKILLWVCPEKVGFWSNFSNKSGQKFLEAFSENGTFWGFLGLFCLIFANLGTYDFKKAHLPTFICYLIAIKSFNICINKAKKVGFWPRAIFHSTKNWFCQAIFTNSPFLFSEYVL